MDTTKSKITGLRMILCNYYSYKVNIVGEQLKTLDKPTCIALIARFRKDKQTYVEALACFVKLCEIDMKITINTDNLAGFKKEVDFYRFIIPFLTDYQRSLVMAYDDQYYLSFPECVGATISILSDREIPDETGALVLLDLKDMGYTSPNAHLDLKSCKLVLSQMAKMHAAPIAVKLVSLEKFKAQVVPHLINARYRKKPYGHLDARTLTADVLKMNDLSDLISYINSVIEYSKSATELDIIEDDTWFTLCHSNFNIRNLMIKYDPTGNPHSSLTSMY
ncbi:uncharacterized protein LOC143196694 isoform X2 [Rhynchophorus ferrugineus]|uniref:CHK kinase-like domain-containing protein n=1 Tax=Rhynchophorus ferrugineus TaxID=354439 RepID=A0A834IH97_RHYFE|nr:hypothetical protein GWI33_006666 [Rhynchophorus ferrugineus]